MRKPSQLVASISELRRGELSVLLHGGYELFRTVPDRTPVFSPSAPGAAGSVSSAVQGPVGEGASHDSLASAKLARADLSEANLRGADLRGADLQLAELREAISTGADFKS